MGINKNTFYNPFLTTKPLKLKFKSRNEIFFFLSNLLSTSNNMLFYCLIFESG